MSFKKYKSQGKIVEVTVNSKEENSWISSKNSASGTPSGGSNLAQEMCYLLNYLRYLRNVLYLKALLVFT